MGKKIVYFGVIWLLAAAAVLTSARLVHSAEGENLLKQLGIPTNATGVIFLSLSSSLIIKLFLHLSSRTPFLLSPPCSSPCFSPLLFFFFVCVCITFISGDNFGPSCAS
jgi:hypothetical protein